MRECPHHGVSNHELTQIFYDGLDPQDRYLLDAASDDIFMSKYEDDVMELIKTVAENSHHKAEKPFGRGAMPKSIDAKSAETRMLLKRIDKMAEVQKLLLDRLNIHNGSKGLAPISLQEASLVAYNPRRHQGMTLRRRRSRHPRASSPLDRRRRRMPTFTTLSEDFISPPQTSSGLRTRGFIVLPFPLFRTFVARTCLSGPLHIFFSLF